MKIIVLGAGQVGSTVAQNLAREHNDVTVYAPEFRCCGMPALDGGDVARATSWAEQNVEVLKPYVEAGCEIVCPGPTCSFMIREEWNNIDQSYIRSLVDSMPRQLKEVLEAKGKRTHS